MYLYPNIIILGEYSDSHYSDYGFRIRKEIVNSDILFKLDFDLENYPMKFNENIKSQIDNNKIVIVSTLNKNSESDPVLYWDAKNENIKHSNIEDALHSRGIYNALENRENTNGEYQVHEEKNKKSVFYPTIDENLNLGSTNIFVITPKATVFYIIYFPKSIDYAKIHSIVSDIVQNTEVLL